MPRVPCLRKANPVTRRPVKAWLSLREGRPCIHVSICPARRGWWTWLQDSSLGAPGADPGEGGFWGCHPAAHVCLCAGSRLPEMWCVGPREGLWGGGWGPAQFPIVRDQDKLPEGCGVPGVSPTPGLLSDRTGSPWAGGQLVDTPMEGWTDRLGQQGGAPWDPPPGTHPCH